MKGVALRTQLARGMVLCLVAMHDIDADLQILAILDDFFHATFLSICFSVSVVCCAVAQRRQEPTPRPDGTEAPPTPRRGLDSFSIARNCHTDCLQTDESTGCITSCNLACNRTRSSNNNRQQRGLLTMQLSHRDVTCTVSTCLTRVCVYHQGVLTKPQQLANLARNFNSLTLML